MANDRVHIKCKSCGGWKMMLKHTFGTGPSPRENGILDWLERHSACHPKARSPDLGGDPGYELYTDDAVGNELALDKQNYVPKT
jgi:hypothetical protein